MLDPPLQEPIPFDPAPVSDIEKGLAAQRSMDLVIASVLLVLATPIMLAVTLAILVEDGRPILFRQERVGRHRRSISLFKFRSMHRDADEEIHREHTIRAINGYTTLRLVNDPRVTRVGKVIRRWSIDEIPNLFNVLHGDMSIVGPRPLVPYEATYIEDGNHALRFAVRPGITGLAQVSGRLDMTFEERLQLGVAYVLNRSVWTDIRIVVKTIPAMFKSRG